jgi:arginine decarboxylase
MPGHKGRPPFSQGALGSAWWRADLTEMPGLDELGHPTGVLNDLEQRACQIWGAAESIISINGATAGLTAAMLAIASRGSTVLVPRNAHRSVVQGLVLSGLFPLWYEPVWDDEWGIWGPVTATSVQRLLEKSGGETAGLVVVSPTYAGALSEIAGIVDQCRQRNIPLIVDEAHGAHFVPGSIMPPSAVTAGADIVVHSLHKSLTGLTQTGMIHVGHESLVSAESMRASLSLLQSTSPSYILMASIEQALAQVDGSQGRKYLTRLDRQCQRLRGELSSRFGVYQPGYGCDPAHVMINIDGVEAQILYDYLCDQGIFPEAVLGNGVLFLLGLGTDDTDIDSLTEALRRFEQQLEPVLANPEPAAKICRPLESTQVLSPRQVFLLPSQVVPAHQAVGRIAAETIAPCPPGTALVIAGQRVPAGILEATDLQRLRVVVE